MVRPYQPGNTSSSSGSPNLAAEEESRNQRNKQNNRDNEWEQYLREEEDLKARAKEEEDKKTRSKTTQPKNKFTKPKSPEEVEWISKEENRIYKEQSILIEEKKKIEDNWKMP